MSISPAPSNDGTDMNTDPSSPAKSSDGLPSGFLMRFFASAPPLCAGRFLADVSRGDLPFAPDGFSPDDFGVFMARSDSTRGGCDTRRAGAVSPLTGWALGKRPRPRDWVHSWRERISPSPARIGYPFGTLWSQQLDLERRTHASAAPTGRTRPPVHTESALVASPAPRPRPSHRRRHPDPIGPEG